VKVGLHAGSSDRNADPVDVSDGEEKYQQPHNAIAASVRLGGHEGPNCLTPTSLL